MGHYSWYNLSPQGKHVTSITFQTLGYFAEAIVFAFIGISASFYEMHYQVSWQFIGAEFVIIMVGRFLAIYISYFLFSFCDKSASGKLSFRQMTFAAYAALIRGAIAFGLVTQLGDEVAEREVLVSSTLALVIITTVFFGGFTAFVQKCLLPSPAVDDDQSETLETQEKQL